MARAWSIEFTDSGMIAAANTVAEAYARELLRVAAMIARNDRNLCVFRPDGVFGNHKRKAGHKLNV